MIVRIAGLMRSGSNLLTWMLRHNFESVDTATMLLGWKHGPIVRDRTVLSIDDYVDPRYREGIRNFVRDHPAQWAQLTSSRLFKQAARQQQDQTFGVALAVRDPGLWYASCVRIQRQVPEFLLHGVSPAESAQFWNAQHAEWLETLGERHVIVDTDALRRDPQPHLDRIAVGLRIRRKAGVQVPQGYLHPQGTEEIYELLGAPITREMERELTTLDDVDAGQCAEFTELLDREILGRLGLAGEWQG